MKRKAIRIISITVIAAFLWQQLALADPGLFYFLRPLATAERGVSEAEDLKTLESGKTGYIDLIGNKPVIYTKTNLILEPTVTFYMLAKHIRLKAIKDVLMVGPTPEEIAIFAQVNKKAHITIAEIDEERLKSLKEFFDKNPKTAKRITLFRADASNLDPEFFPDESFDFIYIGALDESVYATTEEAQRVLPLIAQEQTRLLRAGGHLFHFTAQGVESYYRYALDNGILKKAGVDINVLFQKNPKVTEAINLAERAAQESGGGFFTKYDGMPTFQEGGAQLTVAQKLGRIEAETARLRDALESTNRQFKELGSSILRPLAAGEGESRDAGETTPGNEGRSRAAGEREGLGF